nr:unnamed protein product [Digitaria exilis]
MCGCSALVAGGCLPPPAIPRLRRRRGSSVRAEVLPGGESQRKKVAVAGAGWAGLAAAHHLVKQGYDVTLLAADSGPTEEVGLRGFWYPYRNIFALVDELGISPFTDWNKAAYYSPEGLSFPNLPLVDRFTSIPVIAAVIDFDNTDTAWRKYDAMTARELFKM